MLFSMKQFKSVKKENSLFRCVLNRLEQVVRKEFGFGIYYRSVDSLDSESLIFLHKHLSFKRGPICLSDCRVFFPIFVYENLVGLVLVSNVGGLSVRQLTRLYNTVVFVLKSSLLGVLRLDILHQLEFSLKEEQQKPVSQHCLISAVSTNKMRQAALSIFSKLGKKIFVRKEDLSSIHSAEDIAALGSATIFVSDIKDMNEEEQDSFRKYMQKFSSFEEPQVIIGVKKEGQENLQNPLLQMASQNYLNLSNDFEKLYGKFGNHLKKEYEIVDCLVENFLSCSMTPSLDELQL